MRIFVFFLSTLLTGCAQFGAIESAGVDRGRDAVDGLNARALWQICEGSTLGGYQRLAPEVRAKVDALCIARGGPWTPPGT